MIRWIFLVLIIVNLGVFAWGIQRELRPVEPSPEADASAPRLVLLSELEAVGEPVPAPFSDATERRAPEAPPVDPDPVLRVPLVEAVSAPGPVESRAPSPALVAAVPTEDARPAGEESTAEPAQPEGPQPQAVEPEVGQSETLEAEALEPKAPEPGAAVPGMPALEVLEPGSASDDVIAPATEPSAVEAPEPNCYSIGPFPESEEAEELLAELQADASDASVRKETTQAQNGFWVLIPPLGSRSEAAAEVERIKAMGIDDVWLFYRGNMANAISLGLFARRDLAESHQRDLVGKGVNAELRTRHAEQTVYYVDTGPSLRPDLGQVWAERIADQYPEQAIQTIACP